MRVTDKNLKVKNGYIYIHKTYKGIVVRKSTKLKATEENLAVVKKDLEMLVANMMHEKGYVCVVNNHDLDEYFERSYTLFVRSLDIKQSSLPKYHSFYNEVAKVFKHKRSANMDIDDLNAYAVVLHNKKYSKSDIKFKINTLLRALNEFRRSFNIPELSSKDLRIKHLGQKAQEINPFSEAEAKEILANASGDLKDYLLIALNTGARSGEILALTPKDIDLESNTIHINKTLMQNGDVNDSPKTFSGKRHIPINKDLRAFLADFMQKFKDVPNDRIFSNLTNMREKWKSLLNSLNLKYRSIYQTRHTFASIALLKKVNMLCVAKIMGHSSIDITNRYYAKYVKGSVENIDLGFSA